MPTRQGMVSAHPCLLFILGTGRWKSEVFSPRRGVKKGEIRLISAKTGT
jgi:hypothetical protein